MGVLGVDGFSAGLSAALVGALLLVPNVNVHGEATDAASMEPVVTVTAGFTETQTFDPVTGDQTAEIDANGRSTRLVWDGRGRLTEGWLPEHAALNQASLTFAYTAAVNGLNTIVTKKLVSAGTKAGKDTGTRYATEAVYFDGLGQVFQAQIESVDIGANRDQAPGAVVTHAIYDSVGRGVLEYAPWPDAAISGSGPVVPPVNPPGAITTWTYDGVGRVIAEHLRSDLNTVTWETNTHYDGLTMLSIPPNGGIPSRVTKDGSTGFVMATTSLQGAFSNLTSYLFTGDSGVGDISGRGAARAFLNGALIGAVTGPFLELFEPWVSRHTGVPDQLMRRGLVTIV